MWHHSKSIGTYVSEDGNSQCLKPGQDSQYNRETIATERATLKLGEDTDDDDDPLAGDVVADLEEDEAVIQDK